MSKVMPATVTVAKSHLLRGKPLGKQGEPETEEFDVRSFQTEPALVKVAAQRRCDLGNYESMQVSVEVTVPCYSEEVPAMQTMLAEKVPKKVDQIINQWCADLGYN